MTDPRKPSRTRLYDEKWPEWLDMKTFGPASRWLRDLIRFTLAHVEPGRVRRVLDIGCGEGTTAAFWADTFYPASVTGTDVSASAIAAARRRHRRPNLRFVRDDANRVLSEAFDLISCLEVLEHVEDWRELLNAMAGAARRYLLLSFPVGRMRRFETAVGHLRNFRRGDVERFLSARGFDGLDLRYAGYPFYSPLYRNLCDLLRVPDRAFVRGRYGPAQKIVSAALYFSFRYLSSRRTGGEQFVGLFVTR
jgi:SAM-dependent methyltransferase